SRLLWQERIPHRLHRFGDLQVLAVPRPEQVLRVHELYRRWRAGEVAPRESDSSDLRGWIDRKELRDRFGLVLRETPVTLLLIAVCLLIAAWSGLGRDFRVIAPFLYPDFSYGGSTINLPFVLENFGLEELWRMISPMLLHFSLLHLAFNLLWVWELGKRIEAVQASWAFALLVCVLSLLANTVQFLFSASVLFGGMSGVVYGLFAYIWMWQLLDPAKGLALPWNLIFFMLLSLLVMTALDLDFIANEAHLGGL